MYGFAYDLPGDRHGNWIVDYTCQLEESFPPHESAGVEDLFGESPDILLRIGHAPDYLYEFVSLTEAGELYLMLNTPLDAKLLGLPELHPLGLQKTVHVL